MIGHSFVELVSSSKCVIAKCVAPRCLDDRMFRSKFLSHRNRVKPKLLSAPSSSNTSLVLTQSSRFERESPGKSRYKGLFSEAGGRLSDSRNKGNSYDFTENTKSVVGVRIPVFDFKYIRHILIHENLMSQKLT